MGGPNATPSAAPTSNLRLPIIVFTPLSSCPSISSAYDYLSRDEARSVQSLR
jgi:hypothetical protein